VRSFALLVVLCVLGARAHAESPASVDAARAPLFVRLAPSAHELHAERVRTWERALTRLVLALPNVTYASVELAVTLASEQRLDQPLPPARATVVLGTTAERSLHADVSRLCRSITPELEHARVEVVQHAAQAPRQREGQAAEKAGPISEGAHTLVQLRLALALSLTANALLAGLVLLRSRASRPAKPKVDRRGQGLSPP
jgi:hypothetical protein